MRIQLTEELIAEKLKKRLASAEPSSDGYARVEANDSAQLKCAAVLMPLIWYADEWHLLFTRRTDQVESHKGQVSFPGGACDEDETTAEQTALRESHEEIGIDPKDVRVLGRLADMITITRFRVTPVVGALPWPYVFRVENVEVARVFTMPLGWLAQPSNRWQFLVQPGNRNVIFYHPYDGELLWGATARMTARPMRSCNIGKIAWSLA